MTADDLVLWSAHDPPGSAETTYSSEALPLAASVALDRCHVFLFLSFSKRKNWRKTESSHMISLERRFADPAMSCVLLSVPLFIPSSVSRPLLHCGRRSPTSCAAPRKDDGRLHVHETIHVFVPISVCETSLDQSSWFHNRQHTPNIQNNRGLQIEKDMSLDASLIRRKTSPSDEMFRSCGSLDASHPRPLRELATRFLPEEVLEVFKRRLSWPFVIWRFVTM